MLETVPARRFSGNAKQFAATLIRAIVKSTNFIVYVLLGFWFEFHYV
jgi:hypothetical protein